MNRKTFLAHAVTLWALAATGGAQAAEITIACGSNANDLAFCQRYAEDWARQNGHTIKLYTAPTSSTDNLALLRQQFAAQSTDLDVIRIDVVWPGILKDHLVDLKPYSRGAERQHFPAIVANNTVDGKLVGMPWNVDAGLLYYRSDLLARYGLQPPKTWDDLAAAARKIQEGERAAGSPDFQGFVFQARAYEGLSCNALEWIASFGGGEVVDAAGDITINNPAAARALDTAASWVGNIASLGVLNYDEEGSRGVWQNGQAAFMRNWPYAWSLAQAADSPIKGRVGVSALPAGPGGRPAATLGGWQLAVSKYSKHVDAAASLVMYLSSAEVQKQRAIGGSFNPSLPALYQDPEVLAANPFMGELLGVFNGAVARPATVSGLKYPQLSQSLWDATHDVLAKKTSGAEAVKRLEAQLRRVKRRGW
jgi:trehalose/maltose transport system substrate-binding protein